MLTADITSWLIGNIVDYIEKAAIWCINLFIASLGTLFQSMISILPSMPSVPSFGDFSEWIGYGSYWFPVSWLITEGATLLALWFSWMAIAILLRWIKAVPGED